MNMTHGLLQCQCSGCDQEAFGGAHMLVTLIAVMVSQCMHVSKLTNMYSFNMCNFLYINYISIKL